jgi:hypothetical protein
MVHTSPPRVRTVERNDILRGAALITLRVPIPSDWESRTGTLARRTRENAWRAPREPHLIAIGGRAYQSQPMARPDSDCRRPPRIPDEGQATRAVRPEKRAALSVPVTACH